VLAGKFHVMRRIGAGGMGVVYEATDTTLDRRVALKTLTRLSSPNIERLHREAKAMAAVQHPNLAVIHGIETWKGVPILICEYLAGGTLADRLAGCRLAPPQACDHGATLAGALDYLHRSGLLHRDVKPSNVGYALAGTVKLLDFGLARLFDDGAGAGATTTMRRPGGINQHVAAVPGAVPVAATGMAGTLAYLPPEAIRGEAPGPGFDLWALAVTIYECVCAVNPFLKSSASATIAAVLDGHVPDPRTHEPACPPALADLLMRSLSPHTADRPPSAAALRSGFEHVRTVSA
jgi:serine/threonine protein kinase